MRILAYSWMLLCVPVSEKADCMTALPHMLGIALTMCILLGRARPTSIRWGRLAVKFPNCRVMVEVLWLTPFRILVLSRFGGIRFSVYLVVVMLLMDLLWASNCRTWLFIRYCASLARDIGTRLGGGLLLLCMDTFSWAPRKVPGGEAKNLLSRRGDIRAIG